MLRSTAVWRPPRWTWKWQATDCGLMSATKVAVSDFWTYPETKALASEVWKSAHACWEGNLRSNRRSWNGTTVEAWVRVNRLQGCGHVEARMAILGDSRLCTSNQGLSERQAGAEVYPSIVAAVRRPSRREVLTLFAVVL